MQRLLIGFCALFSSLAAHAAPLTPPQGGQYALMVKGNSGVEYSRHAEQMIAPSSTMMGLTPLAARP